mgnify:CR=1 FL=1
MSKVFLNQKEIDSENNELEKKYIKFFGADAEKPPKHIMKTLVEMKENGTFEDKIKIIEKNYSSIKQKVEKSTGIKISKDHPLLDIDFEKNGEGLGRYFKNSLFILLFRNLSYRNLFCKTSRKTFLFHI